MNDELNREFSKAIASYKKKDVFADMDDSELADALDDYIEYIRDMPADEGFNGQEILGYLNEISKRLRRF